MIVSQDQFKICPVEKLANRRVAKRGLTLVEIMIALTMTLVVLGAMMSAFRYASEKMQMGRGVMEMANRLRSAEELLRNDLANLTLDPRPYTEEVTPSGFLEINEGVGNDATNAGTVAANYLGDVDDSIGMTVRSVEGRRFRGSVVNGAGVDVVIESTIAEVWYFTTLNDLQSNPTLVATDATGVDIDIEDSVRLHRRALLIRPDLNVNGALVIDSNRQTGLSVADVANFVANNDISIHTVPEAGGTFSIVANTLEDLGLRRNRFAHAQATLANNGFPNSPTAALTLARLKPNGEDVLLTDVAGFDVRVYSPNATVGVSASGILVQPGDPSYASVIPTVPVPANRAGAYVDLGYGVDSTGAAVPGVDPAVEWFAGVSAVRSQLTRNYDTWSPLYERDGIDQDADGLVDEGTNAFDNGGDTAAPDDNGERETLPPYPHPIRGVKISTRLIEKTTQQVFQSSVEQSYVPE